MKEGVNEVLFAPSKNFYNKLYLCYKKIDRDDIL